MATIRHLKHVGLTFVLLWVVCLAVTKDDGHLDHVLCPSIPSCECPQPRLVICNERNLTNLALPESTTNIHFWRVYGDSLNVSRLQQLRWAESALKDISKVLINPENLEILDLGGNEIVYLQNYQFQNFTKLKFLNLSNNLIYDLPRNCCYGLDLLEELYLSGNRLHAIPFQVFAPLYNLKILDLSHNFMVTFLDHFFRPNKNIETLLLNNNRITKLTSNALADLKQLKTLELSNNSISTFTKGVLDGLTHLEYLNIGTNPIENLNSGIFSGLNDLKYLNMGNNDLLRLPVGLFTHSSKLTTLILDATKIEVLHDRDLKGLYNLQTLLLSKNKNLRKIEHRVFLDTPKLQHLNISENSLTFLPQSLENLTDIDKLDMADNQWACDCRMRWFATWAKDRERIFKTALSCGPGSYPNDMLLILHNQNCTVPRLIYSTPTTR